MIAFLRRLFRRPRPLVVALRCRECHGLWVVTRFAGEGVDNCPFCKAPREWRR